MIDLPLHAPGILARRLASRRRLLRRHCLNRYHTLRRRWRRWRGGGIPMTYSPPPFIGSTCPRWAPRPIQRLSWALFRRWMDRTDRRWHRELRRRLRREEGLPPD
jgi:hypothetical protein